MGEENITVLRGGCTCQCQTLCASYRQLSVSHDSLSSSAGAPPFSRSHNWPSLRATKLHCLCLTSLASHDRSFDRWRHVILVTCKYCNHTYAHIVCFSFAMSKKCEGCVINYSLHKPLLPHKGCAITPACGDVDAGTCTACIPAHLH